MPKGGPSAVWAGNRRKKSILLASLIGPFLCAPSPVVAGEPIPVEVPASTPVSPAPAPIVAIGDSITFGLGDGGSGSCSVLDPQFNGFCPRLASARRKAVINEGVCGDDSYGGVTRLPAVLERWRPSSLLVLFSPNDLPHPMSEVVENLRTMVRFARERGVVPVLGTLTPVSGPHRSWEPFILALNDRIRRLAQEERIALADHYRAFLGDPSFRGRTGLFLNPDGLHPTARGYGLMAQTWDRALRRGWEPVPVRRPDGLGEDGSAVGPEMRPAAEPSSGY